MSSEQDADRCFRADVQMEMPAMFALRDPSVGKEHFDRFGINEPPRSGQAGKGVHQFRRHIGESAQIARAAVACGERKSVVSGKSLAVRVYLGGRRIMKKK